MRKPLKKFLSEAWHRACEAALPGVAVEVVEHTGSTNEDLLLEARAGAPTKPKVLVAFAQTAGRGRMDRVWYGGPQPGASVLLSVAVPWSAVPLQGAVTLACGLAVAQTLRAHEVAAQIKWPNDVLLQGRKLAGLLAETTLDLENRRTLVVGLGLNLWHPTVGAPFAALSEAVSLPDVRTAWSTWTPRLAAALLEGIAQMRAGGFAAAVGRYESLMAWRGEAVVALDPHTQHVLAQGVLRGVDDAGRVLLDVEGAPVALSSGEISLRRDREGELT